MRRIKPAGAKLFGALNIYFHNRHLARLDAAKEAIEAYPFDAFIVSDLGAFDWLSRAFPDAEFHLSTQANCVNGAAARVYHRMGFSRIVPGRELSLEEIRDIKDAVPELEIEAFAHGAMCVAYSGRCFLSAWMADRSGNLGDCSHSCRWEYKLLRGEVEGEGLYLEEGKRRGEYYPVFEGEDFTSILSSKDICMIDHLKDMRDAGVDSIKIEGRMKSIYYTALVTRAYRSAIDSMNGAADEALAAEYREELFGTSHREFSTGFYFNRNDIEKPTLESYRRQYIFLGTVERKGDFGYALSIKNQIRVDDEIEIIGPDRLATPLGDFVLRNDKGEEVPKADHNAGQFYLEAPDTATLREACILRKAAPG